MATILDDVFNGTKLTSKRLIQLTSLKPVTEADANEKDDGGAVEHSLYPDYLPILDEFENFITWTKVDGKKVPEPK